MSSKRTTLSRTRASMAARLASTVERPNVPAFERSDPTGLRIRTARASDLSQLRELCALAEVQVETAIARAVTAGYAGQALETGLAGGTDAFFNDIMARFTSMSVPTLKDLFLRLTLALVAETDGAGTVGAALAFPPVGTIMHQLKQLQALGAPEPTQIELTLAGTLRVSRIKAVGVRENARRSGVGAALVDACTSAFGGLGYPIVYGIMPPTPGLEKLLQRPRLHHLAA